MQRQPSRRCGSRLTSALKHETRQREPSPGVLDLWQAILPRILCDCAVHEHFPHYIEAARAGLATGYLNARAAIARLGDMTGGLPGRTIATMRERKNSHRKRAQRGMSQRAGGRKAAQTHTGAREKY